MIHLKEKLRTGCIIPALALLVGLTAITAAPAEEASRETISR